MEHPDTHKSQKEIMLERAKVYGDPVVTHTRIALIIEAILLPKLAPGQHLTALDAVQILGHALKGARLMQTPDDLDTRKDQINYLNDITDMILNPDHPLLKEIQDAIRAYKASE